MSDPRAGVALAAVLLACACSSSGAAAGGSAGSAGSAGTGGCTSDANGVIAANQNFPIAVAVDDTNVYWVVESAQPIGSGPVRGAVMTAAKSGCDAQASTFALADQGEIYGLALDADHVYWCGDDGVSSRPKAGGAVAHLSASAGRCALSVVGTHVLVARAVSTDGGLRAELDDIDTTTGNDVTLHVVDAQQVGGVAANASDAYFTAGDSVWRVPRGGGSASAIATGLAAPGGVAVDGANVYWIDGGHTGVDIWLGDGKVVSAPLGGGSATVLASGVIASSLAVDARFAYIIGNPIETEQAPLVAVPLAGGQPITLLAVNAMSDVGYPEVALDATHVYCVARDGAGMGAVRRVPKPQP